MYGHTRRREALLALPVRLAKNAMNGRELPTILIDIKFKHLQALRAKRASALEEGFLIQNAGDYVPATVRIDDRAVPVRLRLKGDMLDHVRGDRWSLRIHTRGDEQLFGLRRFSIQHPRTRGYQGEVLFLETLRRAGVLAPRYFFVNVVVNGDEVGVMAVEEHFSKELLESNGRRDGVIIHFDESLLWAARAARGPDAPHDGPFENYWTAPIDAFLSTRIENSAQLKREYVAAVSLLRAFVDRRLGASDVFDVELLGRYLAVAELWGAWHATVWVNQRFYFNPLTMRLEPIGFDADLHEGLGEGTNATAGKLMPALLEDPQVRAAFERNLLALRRDVESGTLIKELKAVEDRALGELRTEFLLLEGIDFDRLRARAARVPFDPEIDTPKPVPVHLLVSTVVDGGLSYVELANPLVHDVEVVGIDWVAADGAPRPLATQQPLQYPMRVAATAPQQRPEVLRLDYQAQSRPPGAWLEIRSRIAGTSEIKVERARDAYPAARANPLPSGDLADLLARNRFLTAEKDAGVVTAKTGRWQVSGRLVIPSGLTLRIQPGTTLQFASDGALIVYGATDFEGTEREPVVLEAAEAGADRGGHWQGVVVHQAPARSRWSFVNIRDTAGVDWSPASLTGGVTFYRSDVRMSNCTFAGNRAEDALNIIHSNFELQDVVMLNTASDGLDSDFSNGTIKAGVFENIGLARGADAVDVSGSKVTVDGTRFTNVTDKAISVGEGSTLTARNVVAENGGVGAVSKDHSVLDIEDSTIRAMRGAGLMSYVKKPEYGPATLRARRVRIVATANPAQAQIGSSLEIDGRPVTAQAMDVDLFYRTVMKPGLRQ